MSAWADACLRACVDFLLPALTGSDLPKLLQDRAEGLQLILMYSGRKMVLALIWEGGNQQGLKTVPLLQLIFVVVLIPPSSVIVCTFAEKTTKLTVYLPFGTVVYGSKRIMCG